MNKKFKILIIILILILIPVVYFTATTISNQMEQDNFYETIKNVSNNENKSDRLIAEYIQNNENNHSKHMKLMNDSIVDGNKSLNDLKELNNSLHNETLKEYVEIEISRLENEEKLWKNSYKGDQYAIEYYDGKMSLSEALEISKNNNYEINKSYILVSNDKEKAEEFLEKHPDIKNRFEELGIDEDFMIFEEAEIDNKIAKSKR